MKQKKKRERIFEQSSVIIFLDNSHSKTLAYNNTVRVQIIISMHHK